jgi:hypothetical protein
MKQRSSYSKHKTLFPIFGLDGPPAWAIVFHYNCPCCQKPSSVNNGELLTSFLEHVSSKYPVEPKYARGQQHIVKAATDLIEELMVSYTNGDLISKLLYNAINKDYAARIKSY